MHAKEVETYAAIGDLRDVGRRSVAPGLKAHRPKCQERARPSGIENSSPKTKVAAPAPPALAKPEISHHATNAEVKRHHEAARHCVDRHVARGHLARIGPRAAIPENKNVTRDFPATSG